LLDEPLSNLDAKLRGYMRAELVELHQRLGRTMVYVTHDQLEAMTMSDRIAIMEGGRLQQFAPPQDVYREPANRFVAGFIGTPGMNLIDGDLSKSDGQWRFDAPGVTLPAMGLGEDTRPGPTCLGVRPEDLEIGSGPIAGQVQLVEQTGHENIVVLKVGSDLRLTGRVPAQRIWKPGDTVQCSINARNAHFFAAGPTGVRLNLPGQTQDTAGVARLKQDFREATQ
jgi:multiple sugar transport system ATP-binding protein